MIIEYNYYLRQESYLEFVLQSMTGSVDPGMGSITNTVTVQADITHTVTVMSDITNTVTVQADITHTVEDIS